MITDPQVLDFIARTEASYPPEANGASAEQNRQYYDTMSARFLAPRPPSLRVEDLAIGGVACRVYGKDGGRQILFLHGGGFVVGGLDSHDDICAELADATGHQVIAADYRLAPEHIWPAALDDARAVWAAMTRPAIVMGDSAGGMLAAALCIAERDQGKMPIGQILIYPGLGGDGSAASYHDNAQAPLLRTCDLHSYRHLVRGPDPKPDPLAAPLQFPDLSGLPPAFIVTADVDPLRDDGRDYARRLSEAGVTSHWRNELQLPHGYLRARRMSDRARCSFQSIIAAASAMLGRTIVFE